MHAQARDAIGFEPAVRIQKHHQVATCARRTTIAARAESEIFSIVYNVKTCIAGPPRSDSINRAIGGGIVTDDNLDRRGAGKRSLHADAKLGATVGRHNDDATGQTGG